MTPLDQLQDRYDVIVVGGGVAAGACVKTLVEGGYHGRVAVFTSEPHPPYTRPGLSKGVLRGEKPLTAPPMNPVEWYADNGVDLVTGTAVTNVDRLGGTIRAGGHTVAYDQLVLATGAEPRRVPVPAALNGRVHVLRSIADCIRLQPLVQQADARWLVVGGGFIGCEFASSVRMLGGSATVVYPEAVAMERAFGAVAGAWFERGLREHGVELRPNTSVESLTLDGERVRAELRGGDVLEVDHVLVGIGVEPATGLAAQAGLELALGGVAVDAQLRTSDERISAIGDIAAYESTLHGERVRIEHWDVARSHGVHVAQRLLGTDPGDYAQLPYFFSGMGDWAYAEYVGTATSNGVSRATAEDSQLSVAYLDDQQRLVGVIVVDRPDDLESARTLVPQRPKVDVERLRSGAPLADCVIA